MLPFPSHFSDTATIPYPYVVDLLFHQLGSRSLRDGFLASTANLANISSRLWMPCICCFSIMDKSTPPTVQLANMASMDGLSMSCSERILRSFSAFL
jgi:hypothetical protein